MEILVVGKSKFGPGNLLFWLTLLARHINSRPASVYFGVPIPYRNHLSLFNLQYVQHPYQK
jgi:hypothetical protein